MSAALAGRWLPLSAELGGNDLPVASFGGATLLLTVDTYEFGNDRGSYEIVGVDRPAAMDIHGRDGPNAGKTIPAIFALDGDQLTVCYQLGGDGRPAGLFSQTGTQVLLVHYSRAR